jgi:ribosomal protein S27AE
MSEQAEETPKCPKCGETKSISQIVNALRCGQCGCQFNQTKDVVSEAARVRKAAGPVGNWRPPK